LHRRLARDYETLPGSSEAMIHIAMIDNVSRRITDESTPTWRGTYSWIRTNRTPSQGVLVLENISSGPVSLEPGGVVRVTLPSGAGAYDVQAWQRGREQAAAAVAQLSEADEVGEDVAAVYAELDGLEEYLLQVWPHEE
jgi:hypothetical protein